MWTAFLEWWQTLTESAAAIEISWLDLLTSCIILAVSVVLAALFSKVIFRLLLRATRLSSGALDDRIVRAARGPVTAYIILLGLYLAAELPLTLPAVVDDVINKVVALAAVVISATLINAIAAAVLSWVEEYLRRADASTPGSWALPMARRSIVVVVFAMAGMVSLDILGINISPLIAGLGIGGLAVALALQPTLSNLFAGTYVITEGVVSAGDYIEMEGGITGYVVDVNWRSTRLRTWTNNLVIIPNSRFAETIITNYSKPDDHVNVYLTCGVAYESDLHQVEYVSKQVLDEVLHTHPGAVPEYGSYVGYEAFGDSNIDLWLFVQAADRLAAFEVQSEIIKRLHTRFTAEGITINYPVRTLRFADNTPPPELPTHPPGAMSATMPPDGVSTAAARPPADAPGAADGPDI